MLLRKFHTGPAEERPAEAESTAVPGCWLPPSPLCSPTRLAVGQEAQGPVSAGIGARGQSAGSGTPRSHVKNAVLLVQVSNLGETGG